MKRLRHTTSVLTAILLVAAAGTTFAKSAGSVVDNGGALAQVPSDIALASTLQSGGPSLSQAVAQVRRQYGGRILSAETERRGNREVHVIKVLTKDNKVRTVRVNGRRLNGRG